VSRVQVTPLPDNEMETTDWVNAAQPPLDEEERAEWFVELLRDEADPDWHDQQYNALVRMGKSAVNPLIQALKDENEQLRIDTCGILGEIGDVRAIEQLIQSLKDVDAISAKAAWALGRLKDLATTPFLIQALDNQNVEVRWWVIQALGQIGNKQALPALTWLEANDISTSVAGKIRDAARKAIEAINQEPY
jgi:HEAT repeat protein